MSEIRVLQVMGQSTGGIARHVARIVEELDGVEGLSFDIAGPYGLEVPMPKPVALVSIPKGPLGGHRRAAAQLRRRLAAGGYDVVHSHGLRAGLAAGRGARSTSVRTIATLHNLVRADISGRARAAAYRRAEPWLVRSSSHCLAPSADIAARLAAAAPEASGRIEVLHLGIQGHPKVGRDAREVRTELGLEPHRRLIVTVARLVPQKALHVMVNALAALPEEFVLAIVGEGRLRAEIDALIAKLALRERARLLGYRNDAADYVAAADVFALSSTWEACSLAAQEAIALGVPVVSTDVGGMPELIEDGVSGRLVPRGDAVRLAGAIRAVASSPEEARLFVQEARRHLASNFSLDYMIERLAALYRGEASATS